MTNSYDVDHGLSQDAPGPLEPVEIAQQDDTLARTGNTARDQEMYAAGIRTGEENAKHNAAIRGQAITQAPQLQALADKVVISNATGNESLFLAAVKELLAAVREFRPAAPASPVSTVEQGDVQDEIHALRQCAIKYLTWLGVSDPQAGLASDLRNPEMVSKPITMTHPTSRDWKAIDAAVKEYLDGYEMEGDGGYYVPNNRERAILDDAVAGLLADDDFLAHMGRPAPAAGDALDAARWRFVRRKLCLTGNGDGTCAMHAINLPASIPGWPEPGDAVAEFCDAAIDAALAAQRRGES